MSHVPNLITDLTLILCSAAVISLLFKKLKQPIVLGYIIAGLLVGPNLKLFPTVVELESIRTWADIGVIFLLFSLGLEFSFKKLLKVGGIASVTGIMGVGFTMLVGFLAAKIIGWSNMDGLFLGGILSIASTTIIIRAFDELNVKTQKFTEIVMGVLVIEDLVAVVLMVILSTVSISQTFEGTEMLMSIVKLVFFLVLWFVSGIFFLPTLLKKIKKLLNEESLLIVALALCFFMVYLATKAGFSSALGAFIMGSILAETTKAEKIEHILNPLKNLFGAIFFVSVGMLIVPEMILKYIFPILIATFILLIGKPFFVAVGALISGQPLKVSVQTGMSLSQIGEFSFIIAGLGLSLKVTSEFLYPIAVAVSVLTAFTTPFMIRFSDPMYHFLEGRLSPKLIQKLENYSVGAQEVKDDSDWKKIIQFNLTNILVNSVVIITIILLCTKYLAPIMSSYTYKNALTSIITLALISPFLWALAFRRKQPQAYANLWLNKRHRGPLVILMISRVVLSLIYIGFLFDTFYSYKIAFIGVLIASVFLFLLHKKIRAFYARIENRFMQNFNERENSMHEEQSKLTPWDSHLSNFVLNPQSPFIGKTLEEARLREVFGVNIASIERGDNFIIVPNRYERLYPLDVISVIGTDEQLSNFKSFLESTDKELSILSPKNEVSLQFMVVGKDAKIIGKSIRESSIRELTNGLVVGIERNNKRILNPESDFVFELNDKIWIVGNEKRIQVFKK